MLISIPTTALLFWQSRIVYGEAGMFGPLFNEQKGRCKSPLPKIPDASNIIECKGACMDTPGCGHIVWNQEFSFCDLVDECEFIPLGDQGGQVWRIEKEDDKNDNDFGANNSKILQEPQEEVPLTTLIIAVCLGSVLLLFIVLAYCLCKRSNDRESARNKKMYGGDIEMSQVNNEKMFQLLKSIELTSLADFLVEKGWSYFKLMELSGDTALKKDGVCPVAASTIYKAVLKRQSDASSKTFNKRLASRSVDEKKYEPGSESPISIPSYHLNLSPPEGPEGSGRPSASSFRKRSRISAISENRELSMNESIFDPPQHPTMGGHHSTGSSGEPSPDCRNHFLDAPSLPSPLSKHHLSLKSRSSAKSNASVASSSMSFTESMERAKQESIQISGDGFPIHVKIRDNRKQDDPIDKIMTVFPTQTQADLKTKIAMKQRTKPKRVHLVLNGDQLFSEMDQQTLEEMGLKDGSVIHAVIYGSVQKRDEMEYEVSQNELVEARLRAQTHHLKDTYSADAWNHDNDGFHDNDGDIL